MINNLQDAMAICCAYGGPDLFITFVSNTKWLEIVRELQQNARYQPEDKPHLMSRLFKAKLLDMIAYIKSGEPF